MHGGAASAPPPQQDPILLFSHTFLPKSICIEGRRPQWVGAPPPTGNPGSANALRNNFGQNSQVVRQLRIYINQANISICFILSVILGDIRHLKLLSVTVLVERRTLRSWPGRWSGSKGTVK